MIVPLLMILIGLTSALAIWHVCEAIARMTPHTRMAIRASFICKATGLATLIAACADYFFGDPYAWPWLMLAGVALTNTGIAGVYLYNARHCRSAECPVRRIVVLKDGAQHGQ